MTSPARGRPPPLWASALLAPDVWLVFDDGARLPAHSQVLRLGSGVLNSLFELGAAGGGGCGGGGGGACELRVPSDAAADWEKMLAFLYPSVPCAAPRPGAPSAARNHLPPRPAADGITSSSAERLLLLADKWDVPAVKLAVEHFVLAAWEAYSSPAVLTWPRPAPPPGRAPLGAAAGAAAGRAAAGRPRFELRSGCPAAAGSRLRLGQLPAQLRWLRLASEAELPRLFDAIASGIAAERAGRAYGGGGSSGAVSARARAAALLLDPLGAEEARADIRGLSRGDACALLERLLMGGPSGPPSRC